MSAHWFKQFSPSPFCFLPPSSTPSSEPSSVSQMCVGPRRVGAADRRELVTCILCQEEQEVRSQGRAMVLAAFVQRSTVLSKNRQRNLPDPGRGRIMMSSEQNPVSVGVDLDVCECVLEHHDSVFMHPDLSLGIHTASCGHIMHASCWQRWDTGDTYKQNRFSDHKLIVCVCVCFLGILRLCSWRSKDVSSVFEVTPATTLKMESFSVLFVNVWATLWSLSYHTQRHLTTGTYLSLTWGLTEAHVIKPNDASLTVSFILTKCQSSQFWGVAESD